MNRDNLPLNITEKNRSRVSLLCSIAVMLLVSFLISRIDYTLIDKPRIQAEREAEKARIQAEKEAAQTTVTTATVVAVGNNLLDTTLYESGQNTNGTWNYDHLYQNVKSEIEAADVALVSQATPLTTDHTAVSGYPSYLSPGEITSALANAGFDVAAGAGCYTDGYGSQGIRDTLDIWRTQASQIPILGIHDSLEDAGTVQIINVNDIRIAFLNDTYGSRSNGLTSEESYMLDTLEKGAIAQAVQNAREESDCIIFAAHWGDGTSSTPNEYQKQWASYLMSLGVDVIIGSHPMSLQPFGTMSDGNGNETTVFYSLGNFLSIQDSLEGSLGGMARFTIEKTVQGGTTSIRITDKSIEPLVMHYSYMTGSYGPYFLKDYTDELAAQNSLSASLTGETLTVSTLQQKFDEIMKVTVTPSTGTDQLDNAVSGSSSTGSGDGTVPSGDAVTYDSMGGYYDADGNYYDSYGNVYTAQGYYDSSGNFYSYY